MSPAFEILEHTADVGIRAYGSTPEELFANAALGLQSLALDMTRVEPVIPYQLSATGEDPESLLVNWLNEIIFHIDARHVAFARFTFDALTSGGLSAQGWGEPRDPERHPPRLVVKAATYHQLKLIHQQQHYVAEVYLDI